MDINVITRHSIVNYGSFFQTLATQYFFKELGFDCKIIDYISKNETIFGNIKVNSKKRKGIKKIIYPFAKLPDEFLKTIIFNRLTRKELNLTKRKFSSIDDLKEYNFTGILCSGSDQIWGYMPNGKLDPAYFLDFAKENNTCISFAASFGRSDFSLDEWNYIRKELQKFSMISIRENNLVSEINKNYKLDSFSILDPTLMIDPKFWFYFCDSKTKIKNKYILVYQLRKNLDMDKYIKDVEQKTGLRAIRISTSIYDFFKNNTKVLLSPSNVLSYFKNAELIITDSFHATVLSIIFNKQFIDVLPPKTSLRIVDLLSTLQISNRILKSFSDFSLLDNNISYTLINKKIKELRDNYRNKINCKLKELIHDGM